jgi:hypothetical protein
VVLMIYKEALEFRLERLVYSQNMLSAWKRSKKEFIDKYIRRIFWSDDSQLDREYEENMSYGRDFHLMCQRIFLGIDPIRSKSEFDRELDRVSKIYRLYKERYGHDLSFLPEYTIELKDRIQVTYDLMVKIYEGGKLTRLDIWDWKTERKKIEKSNAEMKMQTRLYMYVCKESIGVDLECENIRMYYYQPAIDLQVMVDYTEDKHLSNRNMIYSTIGEIRKIKLEDLREEV